MKNPAALEFFKTMGLPVPIPEHRFHPTRLWRFDYAWPEHRIALEVEGGIWSGGRHNHAAGFLKDMEKYNAAACHGWRIIRITPKSLVTILTVSLVKEAMAA